MHYLADVTVTRVVFDVQIWNSCRNYIRGKDNYTLRLNDVKNNIYMLHIYRCVICFFLYKYSLTSNFIFINTVDHILTQLSGPKCFFYIYDVRARTKVILASAAMINKPSRPRCWTTLYTSMDVTSGKEAATGGRKYLRTCSPRIYAVSCQRYSQRDENTRLQSLVLA